MLERDEGKPLSKEITRHLLQKETAEIFRTDERLSAIVGVSEVMLTRMMQNPHGRLFPLPKEWEDENHKSYNSFVATPTSQLIHCIEDPLVQDNIQHMLEIPEDDLYFSLKDDAKTKDMEHQFISNLGVSLADSDAYGAALNYFWETTPRDPAFIVFPHNEIEVSAELVPYLDPKIISNVSKIAEDARERKGFLLGIDKHAVQNVVDVDTFWWAGVRLSFGPQGMPYQAIAAIEPLGYHEEKFFNELRSKS